jgi:bis(5'-nucleosidyl)-tetraphosphatase
VNGNIFYLVLHYHFKGDYWDFPRGKVEGEETEQQTALREIKEETELDVKFVDGFRETTNWFYRWNGEDVFKEAVYFLAEATEEKVKISHEHIGFMWLEYKAAMKKLTYDNTKEILKAAHKFLKDK